MKLKGNNRGVYEYEVKPNHRKESAIWMLYLMDTSALIEKVIFRQNSLGKLRMNIYIKNINHLQIMNDIQLKVRTLITKTKG